MQKILRTHTHARPEKKSRERVCVCEKICKIVCDQNRTTTYAKLFRENHNRTTTYAKNSTRVCART